MYLSFQGFGNLIPEAEHHTMLHQLQQSCLLENVTHLFRILSGPQILFLSVEFDAKKKIERQ